MERKPISTREIIATLVSKYGGIETLNYYLANALSDIQSMEVGVGDNNPMLAVKSLESARENLNKIKLMVDHKEYRGGIEKEIKDNVA